MRKTTIPMLVLLGMTAFLASCHKKEIPKEKVYPVKVMRLSPKPISSLITLAGTVDSKVHSWVSSPIEGSVESLKVDEGKNVFPGTILCYIMPGEQQNMMGQAQSDYDQAKAEYAALNADEKDAFAVKLHEAGERLESAKRLNKSVPVVSPVKGTVISKNIEAGNNVSSKQLLMEIADTKKLIVKSAVSEEYISKISMGQPVKVKLHSIEGSDFVGKVSLVTPGIRLETRTANIEVTLPVDDRLRPGMTATLAIAVAQKKDALIVPQDALIVKLNGDRFVFIVRQGLAKMMKVNTGIESNSEIEIVSGLKAGDIIVIVGQENLKDGVKVKLPDPGKNEGLKGMKK